MGKREKGGREQAQRSEREQEQEQEQEQEAGAAGVLALRESGRPLLCRARQGRITAGARNLFFETLAATCNVAEACRASGISSAGVYRLRARSAAFRAQWAQALREGYGRLEAVLLERALNGSVKQVVRASSVVDIREYSDQLGLALLRAHRDSVAESEAADAMAEEDIEEVRQRILRKIEIVRKRTAVAAGGGAKGGEGQGE